jgi:D-3-phosphoglycerate dehydrogenase
MKILALDSNHELLNKGLREAGFVVEEDYHSPNEEILQKIENYDGIIIRSRIPLNKEFLVKASNLKFIGRVGAGLENIDEEFAAQKGIILFNAPEGNRDSVAEHTIAMLLILLHRIRIADSEVRTGIWKREENRGDELMHKTVGIIGYGNMGKAFAQRLKGFDVEVICYDILPNKGDENARQVKLEVLFHEADIISLHTPQTLSTKGMINANFLMNFKKPIYFINTARGKSVITKDLVEALKNGKIKGACLDVHEYEKSSFENMNIEELPEDFQYLIKSDKVILTPHIAGWTIQSKEKLAKVILDKILNWKKIHNIV